MISISKWTAFLVIVAMLCMTVSARDVRQGETIYIGEQNLNILTAFPDNAVSLCVWDLTKNNWTDLSCSGSVKFNKDVNTMANWDLDPEHQWKLIPADYYVMTPDHIDPRYGKFTSLLFPTDTPSNLTLVFKVRPSLDMPATSPPTAITSTSTTEPTPDYSAQIAGINHQITIHETEIKDIKETLDQNPVITSTPAPVLTVNVTAIPTVDYEKRLADMDAKIAETQQKQQEQESWIDVILKFLGLSK